LASGVASQNASGLELPELADEVEEPE
jgi:hypothetical protein